MGANPVAKATAARGKPAGVAAVLAAAVAGLPVLFWDPLQSWASDLAGAHGGGGGADFLLLVALFVWLWLGPAAAILAVGSPRPEREGLAAGLLVALLAVGVLASIARHVDGFWGLLLPLAAAFGGLAVALVAGGLRALLRSRPAAEAGDGPR